MATEFEKMLAGEYGDTSDPELSELSLRGRRIWRKMNLLDTQDEGYRELLKELIPGIPDSVIVATPFMCDYGVNIELGEKVFVNYNCCFLDGGKITIGRNTLIGPSVQIYTPQHPMDFVMRRRTIEKSLPVTIGDDCWIGGGVVICPGVTIGDRTIIGAGSVVVKDIPSDVMAAGNPARVIKLLGT